MRIIPAIDLIDGRPVRLSEGDYSRKTAYSLTALDAAKRFEDGGLSFLHLVDLDAAGGNGRDNLRVLEEIASHTALHIDFGGGIRSRESFLRALSAGAERVNVGSLAVRDPAAVLGWEKERPGSVILSADARDGFVAVSGWKENTDLALDVFIRGFAEGGVKAVAVTDIARDGMLSGPSTELYRKLCAAFPELEIIASGGVSSVRDLYELAGTGVSGAIVGKAYYEGRMMIEEMKEAEDACKAHNTMS